jgi:hypothetical protein
MDGGPTLCHQGKRDLISSPSLNGQRPPPLFTKLTHMHPHRLCNHVPSLHPTFPDYNLDHGLHLGPPVSTSRSQAYLPTSYPYVFPNAWPIEVDSIQ